MIKFTNYCIILSLLVLLMSCSDEATAPIQTKEDLKTRIYDKWQITTECIESNCGEIIGTKANELWVFSKVQYTTDEVNLTIGMNRTKATWTKSELYSFPHWVVNVKTYNEKLKVTLEYIYDIIEISPMNGKISVYYYSDDVKGNILLSRYNIIGTRLSVTID